MNFNFTYKDYILLIIKMMKISKINTFKSHAESNLQNGYILRHDVDIDLHCAYKMASIESEMGISSTYFILSTSDLYNINSKKNRQLIKKMDKDGFEIGLHFDPTIYGDVSDEQLYMHVLNETKIIEDIIGKKIESISLHNPSVHNKYPIFINYNNAYDKRFFSEENYISDSCKSFRNKDIFKFIEYGKDNIIQVVFNPIHFSEKQETYSESFLEIIKNKVIEIDDMMKPNKTYNIEEPLLSKLVNTMHNLEIL